MSGVQSARLSTGPGTSANTPAYRASRRDLVIIRKVAAGEKNREIAIYMGITEHVVKNELRMIYDKLGFWNRVELALWYEANYKNYEVHNEKRISC